MLTTATIFISISANIAIFCCYRTYTLSITREYGVVKQILTEMGEGRGKEGAKYGKWRKGKDRPEKWWTEWETSERTGDRRKVESKYSVNRKRKIKQNGNMTNFEYDIINHSFNTHYMPDIEHTTLRKVKVNCSIHKSFLFRLREARSIPIHIGSLISLFIACWFRSWSEILHFYPSKHKYVQFIPVFCRADNSKTIQCTCPSMAMTKTILYA